MRRRALDAGPGGSHTPGTLDQHRTSEPRSGPAPAEGRAGTVCAKRPVFDPAKMVIMQRPSVIERFGPPQGRAARRPVTMGDRIAAMRRLLGGGR